MRPNRRQILRAGALAAAAPLAPRAPWFLGSAGDRPRVTHGVQSGDPTAHGAVILARTDRPARMIVEVAATEAFREVRRYDGPVALEVDDHVARLALDDLPADSTVHYRVSFVDLADRRAVGEPVVGSFRTCPEGSDRRYRLVWSGDVCGQGYGIDPARGGLATFAAMGACSPDLFVHCGDMVYADNPIPPTIELADGTAWRNLTTPETSKVAETLDEFRARYRYNLLDEHVRALHARVPVAAIWDDHETTNNWYPGEVLDDPRYAVRAADLLAARARRAFFDHVPLRRDPRDPERIHRKLSLTPGVDLFLLDLRSHRGPNTANDQQREGPDTPILGAAQLRWLLRGLLASRATWKLIACDMPLGLVVGDGPRFEAVANGLDGAPRGRELEIARLLAGIRAGGVENVVWLTADVHYTAAHHFHPERAACREFTPFWEFVSGPLHAGTFGPGVLDPTFGPEVVFAKAPPEGRANLPPSDGLQFFGVVDYEPRERTLEVRLCDRAGAVLFTQTLAPA